MIAKCPKCSSGNVCQYRQPTGPIWCGDCGYRVEQKEINNGWKQFFKEEKLAKCKCGCQNRK